MPIDFSYSGLVLTPLFSFPIDNVTEEKDGTLQCFQEGRVKGIIFFDWPFVNGAPQHNYGQFVREYYGQGINTELGGYIEWHVLGGSRSMLYDYIKSGIRGGGISINLYPGNLVDII
jgi:hypothetical protein